MSPGKRGKVDAGAPPAKAGGGGGIGALPDDALHHVLSFLPAEEAVRTCVLARRWRHLWKYATGRRIGCGDGNEPPSMEKLWEFVNHLLLLRKRDSTLDTCELRFSYNQGNIDDRRCVNLWIRHIVDREVRNLRLQILRAPSPIYQHQLDHLPLVSQHLTTLVLVGVWFTDSFCNFSNCPNLEHLEIAESEFLFVKEISLRSLKRLIIIDSLFGEGLHTRLQSLVSLTLDTHLDTLPILGNMPSLKVAFVRDAYACWDCACECCLYDEDNNDDDDNNYSEDINKCFLLKRLSKS